MHIKKEGKVRKFRKIVQEKTFAGSCGRGREILYITERCVFRLVQVHEHSKLELMEVAPGVRLQEDILEQMDFRPIIQNVRTMDQRCFQP